MMKNGVCKQEIKFDFSKIEGWHTNDTGSYKTGLDSLKSKPLKYNDSSDTSEQLHPHQQLHCNLRCNPYGYTHKWLTHGLLTTCAW